MSADTELLDPEAEAEFSGAALARELESQQPDQSSAETDPGRLAMALAESLNSPEISLELAYTIDKFSDAETQRAYLQGLDRARQSLMTLKSTEPSLDIDITRSVRDLMPFADPSKALEAVRSVYGDQFGQKIAEFAQFARDPSQKTIDFDQSFVTRLADTYKSLSAAGITQPEKLIGYFAPSLRQPETKTDREVALLEAFTTAGEALDGNFGVVDMVARAQNPVEMAQGLARVNEALQTQDRVAFVSLVINAGLVQDNEPRAKAQKLANTIQAYYKAGLNFSERVDPTDLYKMAEEYGSSEVLDHKVEIYASDQKILREHREAVAASLSAEANSKTTTARAIEDKPSLDQMTEIAARLESLGLNPGQAQDLFESWSTYDALAEAHYRQKEKSVVQPVDIDRVAIEQSLNMLGQVGAITEFADKYGREELSQVIDVFGIYNFARYELNQIHEQLVAWNAGEVPAVNVQVGARSDWNGALRGNAVEFVEGADSAESFRFEAGSAAEVARVAVAVGERERRNGRDPQVRNFIINAHGQPRGLGLGPNGEHIGIRMYIGKDRQREAAGNRSNDYRKHLGNEFKLVLQACSTAGEVKPLPGIEGDRNIADTMSQAHKTVVEASPFITSGAAIINPDGSVIFRTSEGETPAVTYQGQTNPV